MMKTSLKDQFKNTFRIRNELARFLLCEFYATLLLSLLCHAAVAQEFVSRSYSIFNIAIAVGMSVCFAIYTGFGVSGGHINPAISVGIAAAGHFPWRRVPLYSLAQTAGAFVGAALVYAIYKEAFDVFDGGTRQAFGENGTAYIFTTFPQPYLSVTTGFLEQVLNTAILLAIIGPIMDTRNSAAPLNVAPIFFGLIVFTILLTYNYNASSPLNPALDLSGRMLLSAAGYGREVWTPRGIHWWWIPIVGPLIGGAVGSWVYIAFVEFHHPPLDESEGSADDKELELTKCVDHSNCNNNHTSAIKIEYDNGENDDDLSAPSTVETVQHNPPDNDSTQDVFL